MLLAAALSAVIVFTAGCGRSGKEAPQEGQPSAEEPQPPEAEAPLSDTVYPLTIVDSAGNEVTIEAEPQRVISLTPADTEILFAIGAGDRVKGRTDFCNYPEEAALAVSVGTSTTPNIEMILSAEPQIVLSDRMDDGVKAQLEAAGIKVALFSANSIKDTQSAILQIGQIMNQNETASQVVDAMAADLEEIWKTAARVEEPRSVFLDLGDGCSAGPGSLMDDMLNQIGAVNVAADAGIPWPQLSVEAIIEKNPDVCLFMRRTPEELNNVSGLNALDCVKNGRIRFFDAFSPEADRISRPGPRIVEGVRILAESIYPELFLGTVNK